MTMDHDLTTVPAWLRVALGSALPDVFKLEERAYSAGQRKPGISRRGFLQSMTAAAGAVVVDPGEMIWTPGSARKRILVPSTNPFEELQEGVGIVEAFGARYYIALQTRHGDLDLFFDHCWRLLHAVEVVNGRLVVQPMFRPEGVAKFMARTGVLPTELGRMACERMHGIGQGRSLSFVTTTVGRRIRARVPQSIWDDQVDVWTDLTPEQTVSYIRAKGRPGVRP